MGEHVVVLGHYRSQGDLLKLERVTVGGFAPDADQAENVARECCSVPTAKNMVVLPRVYEITGRKQLRAIMAAAQARFDQFEALCRDAAQAQRRRRQDRK